LFDYLDVRVSGFTYKGETNTAKQALLKNQGNCVSLAIVTTAMAKLVGLEIEYQKVNSEPVYDMHEDILLLAGHVRTRVYQPNYLMGEEDIIFQG
jgi:transglutaminase-like putative cysteine protease